MTALKTIPKATVNGAIKLARLPADTVLRAAPESVASSARLAVDRADAAVRNAAGTALRDSQLRDEAERLRAAVAARRRALGLRERASERTEAGEKQAEKARAEAERRRKLANQRAERKRKETRDRRVPPKQMFDQEGSRLARLRALGRVPSRQVATAESA